MKLLFLSAFTFIIAVATLAQSQQTSGYPFYIATTQVYNFPGTSWSESPGDVEQVIREEASYYIVLSPDGTELRLPKVLTKKITVEEAAAALIVERQKAYAQMTQIHQAIRAAQNQQQSPSLETGQSILQFIRDYQLVLGPTAKMQFHRGQSFPGKLLMDYAEIVVEGLTYAIPRNEVIIRHQ